jgi:hypothetical protein
VASLALVADLALIIASKTPEIGMLGAMGASPAMLRRAFLVLGGRFRHRACAAAGSASRCPGAGSLSPAAPARAGNFLDYVPFVVLPADLVAVIDSPSRCPGLLFMPPAVRGARPVEALRR